MTSLTSLADPMRIARRAGTWFILAVLALAGCGGDDDFVPGVPARITLEKSAFTFTALGQTQILLVTVTDGGGDPVDVALNWSTSDPAIVKVNGDGLATAISPGAATVMVSYGSLSSEMAITISQAPARVRAPIGLVQCTEGLEHQTVLFPRRHSRAGGRMCGHEIHEGQDVGP